MDDSCNNQEATESILNCASNDFFDKIEKYLKTKIPKLIRNILLLNDLDSAIVFSTYNSKTIDDLQHFMKNIFNADMLLATEKMDDYLGRYVKCQEKFQFSLGQRAMIQLIVNACLKEGKFNDSPSVISEHQNVYINQKNELAPQNNDLYECVEQPGEEENVRFFNYIGSLMIEIFNDAKRLTLSAWSWPSRHFAAEKSNYFKTNGALLSIPNLKYINPAQHPTFLDSIVETDLENLACRLKNSLALSVRVDGSVDRTQDHNTFVLTSSISKDGVLKTVFLGFSSPENEEDVEDGAAAYFECLKTVVNAILPWGEFLKLTSSLVTDGEPLNTGSRNGLWARILREHQLSNNQNMPLFLIWCVAHRITLAWKSVCDDNSIVVDVIKLASHLCTFFHNSGKRTGKLRNAAKANNLPEPLQYPSFNSTRWVQYAFDLLNVILRNWRPSMMYFISENELVLAQCWLNYDRLHLICFLTDILQLLKSFQKSFESDTNSILELPSKKAKLFERLENCIGNNLENGWEELFLNNIEYVNGDMFFFSHKLVTENRTRNVSIYAFTFEKREAVIRSMLKYLNERLQGDELMQECLKPLHPIALTASTDSLQMCHKFVVPDFVESTFITEYRAAGSLLQGYQFESPLQTLQKLIQVSTESLLSVETALARLAAAKPHSADVERFISTYNKVKDTDRTPLSPSTLFNILYVKMNMPTLDKYDPTAAVRHWMSKKNRRPFEGSRTKQQEWFKGVFDEADTFFKRNHTPIVKF